MRFSTAVLAGLSLLQPAFGALRENNANDALRQLRHKDTLVGDVGRLMFDISVKGNDFAQRLVAEQDKIDFSLFALEPSEQDMALLRENVGQLHSAIAAKDNELASVSLKNVVQTLHSTLEAEESRVGNHQRSRRVMENMESLREAISGIATAIEHGDTRGFVSHMVVIKDSLIAMVERLMIALQGGEEAVVEKTIEEMEAEEARMQAYLEQEAEQAELEAAMENIWIHLFQESNDYIDYFVNEIKLQGTPLGRIVKVFLLPFYFSVVSFIYLATNSSFSCILSGSERCTRLPFLEEQKWHNTAGEIAAASIVREENKAARQNDRQNNFN